MSGLTIAANIALAAAPPILKLIGAIGEKDLKGGVTQIIEIASTVAPLVLRRDLPASAEDDDGNVIAVGVGLFQGGQFGGDPLITHAYSSHGEYLGFGKFPGRMEEGKLYGTTLTSKTADESTEAYQLQMEVDGSESVCLQWVEARWRKKRVAGWLGDWGQACGQAWYHSTLQLGKRPDGKPNYPKCMWFDSPDKDVPHPVAEVSVNLTTFRKDTNPLSMEEDVTDFCNRGLKFSEKISKNHVAPFGSLSSSQRRNRIGPAPGKRSLGEFGPYAVRDGTGSSPSGTSTGSASLTTGTGLPQSSGVLYSSDGHQQRRLILSSFEAHSAKELCDSDTSRGPDFGSVKEQQVCLMDTKKLVPLCEDGDTSDCFDLNDKSNTVAKRLVRRGQSGGPDRQYDTVTHWGPHAENGGQ